MNDPAFSFYIPPSTKTSYNCTFRYQNPDQGWRNYHELRRAVRCKDVGLVRHLVENGAQINDQCEQNPQHTPLHLAVISRSLEILKILLDHGASVNDSDAESETPLMLAARMGNTDVLDLLLSYNVQHCKNERDEFNHLHIACMRNKTDVVKKLVSANNGDNIEDAMERSSLFWPGFTPLHFAVYFGATETVEYLLKCGVDIMAKDSKKLTPLHWADLRRNEEIIDLLLAAHEFEFKNPEGPHGLTHFHIACTRDNALIVERFLKLGVDINSKVQSSVWCGWKPIHLAMYYECPKVIELLLQYEANWTTDPISGCLVPDLLKNAFLARDRTIYKSLTKERIKLNESNEKNDKFSDFHQACIDNDIEKIKLCLSENAMNASTLLNSPISEKYTPLHHAARNNLKNVIKLLIANGANIMVQDSLGKTPLHLAFDHHRNSEIIGIIAENLPDNSENVMDHVGLSILHILCTTRRVEAIQKIMSKGCDINARVGVDSAYWAGFTPMRFASQFEQKAVISLLLKHGADIFIKNESISDHFCLVFEEFHERLYLTDFQKTLFENLMTASSSSSTKTKYSNECGVSPLHALCLNDKVNVETVQHFLITHSNEINQIIKMPQSREFHKCTPLHFAMKFCYLDRAKLLMDAKADSLALNGDGDTPIECAFFSASSSDFSSDEVESLFPHGTPIENLRPSCFFVACCLFASEFVNYILDNVTDSKQRMDFLNCCNDLNETPLHYLGKQRYMGKQESHKRIQMMHLLLQYGVNVDARNYSLSTPLHWTDHDDVVLLLVDYGADVNVQDVHGLTPLHKMCTKSNFDDHSRSIFILLEHGADINIEDKLGRTCLTIVKSFSDDRPYLDKNTVFTLMRHVKKLLMIGLKISEKNEDAYNNLLGRCEEFFDGNAFGRECQKELEIMMSKNIDRRTTLHDILLKNSNEMTYYCENDVLERMVELENNKFPIYGALLRLQIRRGEIRRPLLKNSEESLTFLLGKSLPTLCSEKILQCLSDSELKNVIMSGAKTEIDSNTM